MSAPGQAPLAEALGGAGGWQRQLARLDQFSPFLSGLVHADPGRLERLAAQPADVSLGALVAAQAGTAAAVADGLSVDEARRALRQRRAEHALLVALADLGGLWTLDDVTAALTGFADASVRSAAAIALAEQIAAGKLDASRVGPDGQGSGLVVLAYGKHGAGELNYSSDVDLVVFYDPAAPALPSGAEAARIYNRVAQAMVKLLSERTPDGYVHRVDYRLRPDPGSTPAAISLPAAYTYYETVGQNWERAAMIKARPVAGDLAAGRALLRELEPFIWRKFFDFAAIADIHAMKRQIHAVRGHDRIAVAGHDIKLGRGGIREIEFFVQTQQLVFGGRRPALRGRATLSTLDALQAEGWISGQARDELTAAYRFLRTIEHRLQMVADEQTQRLPSGPSELDRLARFAGYDGTGVFAAELTHRAGRVQHHYGLLFREAPELATREGDLVFTGPTDDPGTLETLTRLGFGEPARAAETVRGWHFGRRAAVTSARAREVLTELVPDLLRALGGTADPDGALARLDQAFGRMPAAVELMIILGSNERLLTLFADLLGTAPRLAETVAASPHVLDAVIDPSFVEPARSPSAIEADLRAMIGEPAGTEEFLDRLREAAHQLQFVTGARLLSGLLPPADAGRAFAAVAQAAIRVSLDWVSDAFAAEHGRVSGGEAAVLGLGRLGAADLTATSDLDLVVIYDFDPDRRVSDGTRPLDAVTYYTRLTQRLVAALTAPTRRGRLFAIDLRLRPSGTKGPVATQLKSFEAYHAGEAELWEEMALTRARVVAGDPGLSRRIDDAVTGVVRRPRERASVFGGVAAMRDLVEREKGGGESDLKLAPGGLLDLDFLAQALVLEHAAAIPSLVGLSTEAVLREAGRLGLVGLADADVLVAAAHLFGDVQHWERLAVREGDDTLPEAVTARLAALTGAPDPKTLGPFLAGKRAEVRTRFEAILRG